VSFSLTGMYPPVFLIESSSSPAIHFCNGRALGLSDLLRKKLRPAMGSGRVEGGGAGIFYG
jgi:hypothetical protein